MIFSAYRACCCLGECVSYGCCWKCPDDDNCIFWCNCSDVPCDQQDPVCPCGFAAGPDVAADLCAGECELGGFEIPEFCDNLCDPPGGSEVFLAVKCVKCSYYDTDAAGGIDEDVTAGTPLLEETICYRASPGITDGTDLGGPTFPNPGSSPPAWSGGTGGILDNTTTACPETIFRGGYTNYLASIEYCGCTGCTTPDLFYGGGITTTTINVCGLSGW